jgi:hypothetical protein
MSLSLRSFHLFFIAISILLAVGLCLWGFWAYFTEASVLGLVLGILFLALTVILAVYGPRARRKLGELDSD